MTGAAYPLEPLDHATTMVEILRGRAALHGDLIAYTFLEDGEQNERSVTYAELDRRARAIAATLHREHGAGEHGAAGTRAILLYPPGLDYIAAFFGCLYAGVVAVPAYPPDPTRLGRSLPRLQAVFADAEAGCLLTTAAISRLAESLFRYAPDLKDAQWLTTDTVAEGAESAWTPPPVTADSLAFLQYTSGSTGTPKGVMLSHANLLHNEQLITLGFALSRPAVCVSWLPPYHDMGLIGTILHPMYLGYPLVAMSPLAFLQRPMRWLEAVHRHRGTCSGGPNFAYDLCLRKSTPEQRRALDLSSWELAFCGAEPVRADTLDRFADAFAPAGFQRQASYPCYGLAEGTLIVSGGQKSSTPIVRPYVGAALTRGVVAPAESDTGQGTKTLVGCGTTLPGQDIAIVEPSSLERLPEGRVGEIWVSGSSVASGYWRREAESESIFAARLADRSSDRAYLRTGDLGFLDGGELFVTGRAKAVIIQRGRNMHAEDIEQCAERAHAAMRPGCSAAFSIEEGGEERLILVAETSGRTEEETDACIAAVYRQIAEDLEIQAHHIILIRARTIAKTSSGKIQRYAVRDALLAEKLETVAERRFTSLDPAPLADDAHADDAHAADAHDAGPRPETPEQVTSWLRARTARLLGLRDQEIAAEEPLASLGLDSLQTVELQHALENELGIVLPLASLMEAESLRALAERVADRRATPADTHAEPSRHEYPLSHGQRGLLFLQDLSPDSPAYLIARRARLDGSIDLASFRRALDALIARHPILRTTIARSADGAVARVAPEGGECFEYIEASAWDETRFSRALEQHETRPFDLARGPLVRVAIFQRSEREFVFSIAIHHLISDFWSLGVMMRDLGALYDAERDGSPAPLAPPRLDYSHFVAAQEARDSAPEIERAWSYWTSRLSGDLPAIDLPAARVRPRAPTHRGSAVSFALDRDLTAGVFQLARTTGTTPFVTLLSAFFALLHRLSGQDDLIVGVPSAGRSRAGYADVLGYFVNSLPIRVDASADLPAGGLIDQVAAAVKGAIHHELPFTQLVEKLPHARDASRSPIFQVMFVLQQTSSALDPSLGGFAVGAPGVTMDLGGLTLETMDLERDHTQFDLTLLMAEVDGSLRGSLEYSRDLFDREDVVRMTSQLEHVLRTCVSRPETPLSALTLGAESERRRVLEWSRGQSTATDGACLHESFRAVVENTPSAVAVLDGDRTLTYAELAARASWLARRLRAMDIDVGARVAIVMGRSLEMVVALLATLEAGAAFVPIDPEAPRARIEALLDDVEPGAILTSERLIGRFADHRALALAVPDDPSAYAPAAPLDSAVRPDDLAYVTFTSGSTGTPKGVMVPHRAIANHLAARQALYPLRADDRFLHKAVMTFDIAVWEVFGPLLAGARLVLARDGGQRDPRYLAEICEREGVTVIHFGPAMLRAFIDEPGVAECACLRRLFCGGEPLTPDLRDRVFERLPGVSLHNQYGPTETAVDVTFWDCAPDDDERVIPIGRGIHDTSLYVLDEQMDVVPCGVPGELHIGGACLAWGYLGRPAETAERFVPSPFGPPGAVLYRTGDRVLYRDDGAIQFLGRRDRQIKLRGNRIELGEVENTLRQHAAVKNAVALVRKDVLVAYAVSADEAPDGDALRNFLRQRLPEYMVPSAVMSLDALPLTPSGKLDLRALPEIVPHAGVPHVEATTESERAIAAIWSEVLDVPSVGVDDDFFDRGGHSLRAVQVVARIRERMGVEVPLRSMYDSPTIRALAGAIDQAPRAQKPAPITRSMTSLAHDALDKLDELSDEEVERLLAKVRGT